MTQVTELPMPHCVEEHRLLAPAAQVHTCMNSGNGQSGSAAEAAGGGNATLQA